MAQEVVIHSGVVYNDAATGNDIAVDFIVLNEQPAAATGLFVPIAGEGGLAGMGGLAGKGGGLTG